MQWSASITLSTLHSLESNCIFHPPLMSYLPSMIPPSPVVLTSMRMLVHHLSYCCFFYVCVVECMQKPLYNVCPCKRMVCSYWRSPFTLPGLQIIPSIQTNESSRCWNFSTHLIEKCVLLMLSKYHI